jgi:Protein of unknown function (DUF1592)/Protein of unknown function (DUF1588)/Protein of unknown function (DUF1587)/Protein of unknown function (DUF1585)/Protein of unknown function (DUF1595)/Planctomycete cytochrome C
MPMHSSRLSSLKSPSVAALLTACLLFFVSDVTAADPFRDRIVPFVTTYCSECHNAERSEAELNLIRFQSAESAAEEFRQWEHVITFVQREEMPPKSAKQQPSADARSDFLKVLRTVLDGEARKLAGDPGVVLPRRLSNAEFDHTIRDLTGVDIRPTRSFPVDPAAGEGFDNTGEALRMSPSLFAKLYEAAQHVADHAVLTTTGLEFAPYPVATFADRAKFYEQAIIRFYETHKVDYDVYLAACWEYRYRPPTRRDATISEWARERNLSPKYLQSLHDLLGSDPDADRFYLGWLRRRWNELPAPAEAAVPIPSAEVRAAIHRLATEIQALSRELCPKETEAIISNAGNAPIQHLERRRKTAAERDTFDAKTIQLTRRLHREFKNIDALPVVRVVLTASSFGSEGQPGDGGVILKSMNFTTAPADSYKPNDDKRNLSLRTLLAEYAPEQLERLKFGVHPRGDAIDADACVLAVPGTLEIEIPAKAFGDKRELRFFVDAELDRAHSKSGLAAVALGNNTIVSDEGKTVGDYRIPPTLLVDPENPVARDIEASCTAFCRVFPNRFAFVDETRGLSAGFHLIEGFFRDDKSLCKHVLSDDENQQLDRLWTELEFVTEITERMLRGFVFFERSERNFLKNAEFDSFKEEDPKLVETETLNRFERVYLDRSNVKAPVEELGAHPIHIFFEQIRNGLRLRREHLRQAEPIYLRNLEDFARSAYRRPLTEKELSDLRSFFHEVSGSEEHGLEQAVRASIVRVLVSPYFHCRIDPSPAGDTVRPIGDLALASRLSYFLWSSMPDAELMAVADAGQLHDEQVLLAQTRRMLKDPKVSDFAREFFGQWLGYRNFLEQEAVDRSVFRDFDEPLKQAMFEEPTRLAAHLIRQDRPVIELLDADVTFVDQRLARHYGLPFTGTGDEWVPINGLRQLGRGGILGMAVFLTKNSQPQRTSPVKRGFWVVHKVLGEHIPAPPADVVALPAKETDTNGKTIRELLTLHVEADKCARCHVRFDAVGLSMEGFDPIGRSRTKDLAGRPVDNVVRLADGTEARGVPEFAGVLVKTRRDDFIRTLCHKLLGYALGRSLQLSDDVLLEEMRVALDKNGDRFVPLFETIVRSPQFRNQRCRDFSTSRFRAQNQGERR